MDKSGFRRFFFLLLVPFSLLSVCTNRFLFDEHGRYTQTFKDLHHAVFRNLFRGRKFIHINGRINLDNTTKEKSTERNIKIINIPTP